jgi:fluoroacetyl-CoA thioesterase
MKPVPIGAKGTFTRNVADADLASKLDSSLAAVMSTPTMIAMMELAAMDAVRPYLDAGEGSVGVAIDVRHVAATPPGWRVTAEAEVTRSEGRKLELKVWAHDEKEEIGSGVHQRAIIDTARFKDRVDAKAKA